MASRVNEVKTLKLTALRDAIKTGDSVANPVLNIVAAAGTVLWTTALDATDPIESITDGVGALKLSTGSWVDYSKAPSANGTADHVEILDRNGDVCRIATVGVGSGEFPLPSLSLVTTTNLDFAAAPVLTQS